MGLGVTGGVTFELCGIGGIDNTELSDTAKRFAMELSSDPRVMYATTSYNADTPQIYLDIDRKKAESLGLTAGKIFSALQSSFASIYVNDFTMAGQNYEVKIQSSAGDRQSLNNVYSLQIPNSSGEMVPLSSVAPCGTRSVPTRSYVSTK